MTVPEWPAKQVPAINYAMVDLLECVDDALSVLGQGPTCHSEIVAGNQPQWTGCDDDCDVCGMSFVSPGEVFRYTTFPIPDDNSTRLGCQGAFAYELLVGVVRCFPTMEVGGERPEAEALTTATLLLMEDQRALLTAIECCDSKYLSNKSLAEWTITGPDGGCIQGAWRLYVDPH